MTEEGRQPLDDFEAELEDLGPLMAQQEIAYASEPDPEFIRTLRDRLTGDAQPVPVLRQPSLLSRIGQWLGENRALATGAALVAAALIVVAAGVLRGSSLAPGSSRSLAFAPPTPKTSDITRSYPGAGGLGAGGIPPVWYSYAQPVAGIAYPGRLVLQGQPPAGGPSHAAAYRLNGPSFDLPRLRTLAAKLGIHGTPKSVTVGGQTWRYIQEVPGRLQVHSIAINTRTGELVYHDTSVPPVSGGLSGRQVAAAQRWLRSMGWPSRAMVPRAPTTNGEKLAPWVVQFGWRGTSATVPAAAVVANRQGAIVEAFVEPPVERDESVPIVSRGGAWNELRRRGGPIGVDGETAIGAKPGTASLAHSSLTEVLTRGEGGTRYLVPSYQFEGNAAISGVAGPRHWIAIVPATK
jgi:hypothetical protein